MQSKQNNVSQARWPTMRAYFAPGKGCGAAQASSQQPGLFLTAPDIGGPRCPLGVFRPPRRYNITASRRPAPSGGVANGLLGP